MDTHFHTQGEREAYAEDLRAQAAELREEAEAADLEGSDQYALDCRTRARDFEDAADWALYQA